MQKLFIIFIFFFPGNIFSQDGVLDPSFGLDGYAFTEETDQCYDAVIQPDGKIILAGNSGYHNLAALRYDVNGTLDTSFNHNGKLVIDGEERMDVYAVALQSDGKIILGGSTEYEGDDQPAIWRLNPDGTVDSTFATNGLSRFTFAPPDSYDEYISDISVQADDKIVFCGSTNPGWDDISNPAFVIGRTDVNGLIDSSFGVNGFAINSFAGKDNYANTLVIQSDNKIVAGGISDDYFGLVRYNQNGIIDSSFGTNGKVLTEVQEYAVIKQLALQEDGKIVAMGFYGATNKDIAVVRYHMNGTIDADFGTAGIVTTDIVNSEENHYGLLVQPDHKILIASHWKIGWEYASYYYIERLTPAGQPDTTFGIEGELFIDPNDAQNYPCKMLYQGDGKVIIAGYAESYDPYVSDFTAIRILIELDTIETALNDFDESISGNNPVIIFSDNLLKIIMPIDLSGDIAVYTVSGQLIKQCEISGGETTIDLNSFSQGIYLVSLKNQKEGINRKIYITQ